MKAAAVWKFGEQWCSGWRCTVVVMALGRYAACSEMGMVSCAYEKQRTMMQALRGGTSEATTSVTGRLVSCVTKYVGWILPIGRGVVRQW